MFLNFVHLFCVVGSFSEHLDQINGRSESVDSTDNFSKPSSESASRMARQRLETTEKKKISGKVTKSLSASALSLMIPGGRDYYYYYEIDTGVILFFMQCVLSANFLAPIIVSDTDSIVFLFLKSLVIKHAIICENLFDVLVTLLQNRKMDLAFVNHSDLNMT